MITRHFVDAINPDGSKRRVHYRKAGKGPPVLLVHQSPRSSLEYLPLLEKWAGDFTLIAPDTAGFGCSAPLNNNDPDLADYGAALIAFMDALGLKQAGAYGFHSGASIAAAAARLAPERFTALACSGYSIWTDAERADFAANYTPKFLPMHYGEHLAWLWGRLLEQTWFFPWYRTEDAARLPMANADAERLHPAVMDVLAAGDTFRLGYAAVLSAKKDMPGPGEATPPVLLTAYDGDPLKAHLARMGALPGGWEIKALNTPAETEAVSREFLLAHAAPVAAIGAETADEGFAVVTSPKFNGVVHWQGSRDAKHIALHAPGSAAAIVAGPDVLAIDLPGHGLSDDWASAPDGLADWVAVLEAMDLPQATVVGHDASAALAKAWRSNADAAGRPPSGDLARWRAEGLPDLTPDRYGSYLQHAWAAIRAQTFFHPWFEPAGKNAIPFDPADAAPERLAERHLALMQARSGRVLLSHCLDAMG